MYKIEFIETIAEQSGFSKKEVSTLLNTILEVAADSLASGEDVCITGFGTFKNRRRNARKGRNPATGESILIPASRTIVFRASNTLKTKCKELP